MKSIHGLLETAIQLGASDLLIKAGSPPYVRVDGRMHQVGQEPLSMQDAEDLAQGIISSSIRDCLLQESMVAGPASCEDLIESRIETLREKEEIDLVFTIPGLARVRANIFLQRNMIGAALRVIPLAPKSLDDLHLPTALGSWADQPQGLIVITGPTGSGKSTTLAAMIDHINSTREGHIIAIEDPIEHVFEGKKSIITQREIGGDTRSYSKALQSALRQTPDVIVIGEMRDAEIFDAAMTAGEVGHLVITTLHTNSAVAAVDRILGSFPPDARQQVAVRLSTSLVGISSQRLVARAGAKGRLPAVELMTASPTIKKLIEEAQISELYPAIREGQHFGMNTMNQALEILLRSQAITQEDAILNAGNQAELRKMLRRG